MKTTEDWADEAVQAGINFLNDHAPSDWRSRINLERLDIFSCTNCVAGQVWADKVDHDFDSGYHYLVDRLLPTLGLRDAFRPVEYGFAPGYAQPYNDDSWVGSCDLMDAWKRALQSV